MIAVWIGLVVLIYLILVFLIPLFFFSGFLRNVKISNKSRDIARRLKKKNKRETLKAVFNYVEKQYSSERYKLLVLIHRLFYTNVNKIVDKKMFLPCHIQNFVLRTLLISTKQFSEKDFKKKVVLAPWVIVHEYCLVKVGDKVFKVDPFYNILKEKKEK